MMSDKSTGADFKVLRMSMLASSELTGGSMEVIEDIRNAGEGPAPHIHDQRDEAFYVLTGAFEFGRGAELLQAPVGDLVFIPRGTRHYYRAQSNNSRLLLVVVPAGLEAFLREMDGLLHQGMSSYDAMLALAGRYDSTPVD